MVYAHVNQRAALGKSGNLNDQWLHLFAASPNSYMYSSNSILPTKERKKKENTGYSIADHRIQSKKVLLCAYTCVTCNTIYPSSICENNKKYWFYFIVSYTKISKLINRDDPYSINEFSKTLFCKFLFLTRRIINSISYWILNIKACQRYKKEKISYSICEFYKK